MKIYYVRWLDAWSDDRPHIGLDELEPEEPRKIVGFLVKVDEVYEYYATIVDGDDNEDYGHVLKIPVGCIVDKTELTLH
uniref:Uncharacterized protein n=1 Tax=viral metagenome TaxID=1070528 RepID=A0A6H1ZKP5_9ZZZZ